MKPISSIDRRLAIGVRCNLYYAAAKNNRFASIFRIKYPKTHFNTEMGFVVFTSLLLTLTTFYIFFIYSIKKSQKYFLKQIKLLNYQ